MALADLAIDEDAVSSDTNSVGTGTSLTFSHTLGATADLLLVIAGTYRSAGWEAPSGVTYDGDALTKKHESENSGTEQGCSIWYMPAADLPASGAHDIVITTANACEIQGVGFSLIPDIRIIS